MPGSPGEAGQGSFFGQGSLRAVPGISPKSVGVWGLPGLPLGKTSLTRRARPASKHALQITAAQALWAPGSSARKPSSAFFAPCSTKPKDSVYIHDPDNSEDSNVALEKLRDVIAQCILPQAGKGHQR